MPTDDHGEDAGDGVQDEQHQGGYGEQQLGRGVRRHAQPAGRGREGAVLTGPSFPIAGRPGGGAGTTTGRVLAPLTRRLRTRRLETSRHAPKETSCRTAATR